MRGDELVVLQRTELFEEVWTRPVQTIAGEYGISGVALAKICRKMSIPLPGRGYWARKAAGKRVDRPALPAARKGEPNEHRFRRREPIPPDSPNVAAVKEREGDSALRIVVGEGTDLTHPLTRRSAPHVRAAAKQFARASDRHQCLDLLVSPDQVGRALRIMDALLKALERRGYSVEVPVPGGGGSSGRSTASATRVLVAGEWIHVSLEERRAQVRLPPPTGKGPGSWYYPRIDLKPTGELRLLITNSPWSEGIRKSWGDSKTRRLENCLNEFVVGLSQAADAIKRDRARRERWEAELAEQQRRAQETAKLKAIEGRLAGDLDSRAAEWRRAQDLLCYLDAVEVSPRTRQPPDSEDVDRWLAWARSRAENLAHRALSNLLQLRPVKRDDGAGWREPTVEVTPEDVALYLRGRSQPRS